MSRPSRAWLAYAVAGTLLLAGAYLCFELGRYQAGYSIIDHRRVITALDEQIAKQRATADDLHRQIAIFETSRRIDQETYSQIQANLADLQARIQTQEEELMVYRGIVSPRDGVSGLRIQSLSVVPADGERHYVVRLVLLQAVVHSRRVTGTVKLQLEGVQDGRMTSLEAADLVPDKASYDMAYEFRYFQGLECELILPVGFEPGRFRVEIAPNDPHADKVDQSFEWSDVTE
jgi:Tfp pilus assembly protein PilN